MIETVPSGTILNRRYRIERVLGSGGFGHVYLALDQSLNQPFAVKEYLVSGPSGQEQLMHEANVLSHLHHPNLPAFHDAFHENGHYYVVLNYIEGNDLTDIIRNTQKHSEIVPISQIMAWILSICDAVLFLHRQQPRVIHRDIKPDNIRVTSNGTAILVDLGNAKAAAQGERTLFFIRHQGTPGYAPPEQYPGGSGTDTRSDIYALGGTLFFALTGQEPPSVSTRNQSMQQNQPDLPSLQEVLAKNPREDESNPVKQFRLGVSKPAKPAPRHSRHLAQLTALSPIALGQLSLILQKAMAMRPRERYQNVADFANDLKKIVALMPNTSASSYDTQPVGPSQNQYKTQSDLPMAYDMLQQAKAGQTPIEPIAPGIPTIQPMQSSSTSPATSPSTGESCPHCGALHKVGAAFCPHCGASLRNEQRISPASSIPYPANYAHEDHHTPVAISTSIPQTQQDIAQHPLSKSPTTPPISTPSSAAQQFTDTVSSWSTTSASSQTPTIRASQSQGQSNQSKGTSASSHSSLNIGLILIVVLAIILLILIIILVMLLVRIA